MRKIFFLTALLATYIFTQAQIKPPASIANAFAKQFPDANQVKWGKENAREFEAEFMLKDMKMSANYDLQGNWKETEMEVSIKNLPEEVVKSINAKYPGAIVFEADRIENTSGKIIYETNIKMNGKKKAIELFADGKFVK